MSSKLSVAKVAGHIGRISSGITIEKNDRKLAIPSHRKLRRFESIEEYSECVKKICGL